MRSVQPSSTAAKHGITQASATAPAAVTGAKGVDAFQALVQALADSAPTDQAGQGSAETNAPANDSAQTPASAAAVPTSGEGAVIALTPAIATKTTGKAAKDPANDDPTAGTPASAPTADSGDQTLTAEMAALALLTPVAIAPAPTATATDASSIGAASAADALLATSPAHNPAPIAGDTPPAAQPLAGAADSNSAAPAAQPGPLPTHPAKANLTTADLASQPQVPVPAQPPLPTNPTMDMVLTDMAKTILANTSSTPTPAGLKLAQPTTAKPAVKSTPPSTATAGTGESAKVDKTAAIDTTGAPVARGIGAPIGSSGLPAPPAHANKASTASANSSTSDAHGADAGSAATPSDAHAAAPAAIDSGSLPVIADAAVTNSLSGTPSDATAGTASSGASTGIAGSTPLNTSAADPQSLTVLPRSAALAASAVAQVNVVLQRAGLSRAADSLTVQLDPAELGRVEVKLKMTKEAPVHATVTADRPQTLEMLRNDKGALERALQSAGLSTNSGSLSFNLRGDGGAGQQTNFGQARNGARTAAGTDSSISQTLDVIAAPNGWTAAGHLDLRV